MKYGKGKLEITLMSESEVIVPGCYAKKKLEKPGSHTAEKPETDIALRYTFLYFPKKVPTILTPVFNSIHTEED